MKTRDDIAAAKAVIRNIAQQLWDRLDFKVQKQSVYYNYIENTFKVTPALGPRAARYMLDPDRYELFGIYWHVPKLQFLVDDLEYFFEERDLDPETLVNNKNLVGKPYDSYSKE